MLFHFGWSLCIVCYLILEDPLGKCGLDDVGSVEAVDAVDAEDALLLADDAVRVHPAVAHGADLVLECVDQDGDVLEVHSAAVVVEVEGHEGERRVVVGKGVVEIGVGYDLRERYGRIFLFSQVCLSHHSSIINSSFINE